jgi:predicted ATP-binding protein involved in virulence
MGEVNLPVFVYYPVNRAVLDIPLRIREKHRFDLLSAYDESLTSGANFRTFFEWFREREDLENENLRHMLKTFAEARRRFNFRTGNLKRYARH